MAIPIKKASVSESLAVISNVALGAFVVCALYFGRDILVPLALAALLTFIFTPLVKRLQRLIGNIGSILVVVVILFATTGVVGWILMRQAVDLANRLPGYKENIRTKLHAIPLPSEGPFSRVSQTFQELEQELPGAESRTSPAEEADSKAPEEQATLVRVVEPKDEGIKFFFQSFVTPVLGPLGTAGLVMVLLIFMLFQREDLRNRLVGLLGHGRIGVTTTAIDEVGARVSRYLVMQVIVNVTYGIPVAIGLYFIGVPNALLWGALATILRFIPYVGPWIAAAFPILLSLAISPSWLIPVLTIALFVTLELLSNNIMEPWLYGSSTGVTPIALIVAALVWTWLWGPVGLVLATPMTMCLVVMGKLVPRLAFLSILLSDEEPLTPAEDCYHRLHSAGEAGEMELVDAFLENNSLSALFDEMLIPVIITSESDHQLGLLGEDQLESIHRGIKNILNDLDLGPEAIEGSSKIGTEHRICCLPSRAYRDELAGEMVAQVLQKMGLHSQNAPARMTSGELIGWVRESEAWVACISAVAPTAAIHPRYLCSKLRRNFPHIRIIVCLWGHRGSLTETMQILQESGADDVVTTVTEAAERISRYKPLKNIDSGTADVELTANGRS